MSGARGTRRVSEDDAPGRLSSDGPTLGQRLEQLAREQPDRTAFTVLTGVDLDEEKLTWEALHRRAARVAAALSGRGLAGRPLALLQPTSVEWLVAFFGALLAGCPAVPVNAPRSAASLERLRGVLNDAGVVGGFIERAGAARLSELLAASDGAVLGEILDVATLEAAPGDPPPAPRGRDVAVLQYTSGSTSEPKGVRVTHANFFANGALLRRTCGFGPEDVFVSWLPLFHDMGLTTGVILPLLTGAPAVLMAPAAFMGRPVQWLEALSRYGGTASGAPNFAYDLCVDRIPPEALAGIDLSGWRIAVSGAEPVRIGTLDRFVDRFAGVGFRRSALVACYGMAETTLYVSGGPRPDGPLSLALDREALEVEGLAKPARREGPVTHIVACGEVNPEMEIRIVDPKSGREQPGGAVGEIWIRGESVGEGYVSGPLTLAAFGASIGEETGFYRSGDLGFLQSDSLFVTGRLKDMIIVRGVNHYPQDLELTVRESHAALADGVGVAFGTGSDDEGVVIVQELAKQYPGDPAEVLSAIRRIVAREHGLNLADVMLVERGGVLRTTSGKVQRRATRKAYEAETLPEIARSRAGAEGPMLAAPTAKKERVILDAWQRILGLDHIGPTQNFFDVGGDSLAMWGVHALLVDALDSGLLITDLLEHPTARSLAAHLEHHGSDSIVRAIERGRARRHGGVAIIGMAGRFPGAPDTETFWRNLESGAESILRLPPKPGDPGYVAAAAPAPNAHEFDAAHFHCSPREAASMDPQQRILLECAVEALEDAGCNPETFSGAIGVYAGAAFNFRRHADVSHALASADSSERWLSLMGADKDYLATRLSYRLHLTGPSITVQTACSTSLVAVHMACQSLINGECDAALAGGVSVTQPEEPEGYHFSAGDVLSPDGTCRPFDAKAAGTIFADGAGLVVLKRLEDALADGDNIRAVIRGTAVNNDASVKVSFTAPSVVGQAAVVAEALAAADIPVERIAFVEGHGTGTALGDPIEVAALTKAFRAFTAETGFCRLGSVKGNIGHLNAAAGVAGLIKSVLSLEQGAVPGIANFEAPNPKIDFERTPFVVDAAGCRLPEQPMPWAAGVSSFGFGGTNAHVVLEAAPAGTPAPTARRDHALVLSADSPTALEALQTRLAHRLEGDPDICLADVANTLIRGRRQRACVSVVVGRTGLEVAGQLLALPPRTAASGVRPETPPPIAFLLPGQGSPRPGAGAGLYGAEPEFRRAFDACAELFHEHVGDLRSLAFDANSGADLSQTAIAQPLVFALSYAMARQWAAWNVTPSAYLGHSLGELTAACLAGVFSLEDATRLVALRGRLMQAQPRGAMLAILAPLAEVQSRLGPDISLAAINGPQANVVAGPETAIAALAGQLTEEGVACAPLRTSHAFHSSMMTEAAAAFEAAVRQVSPMAPHTPFLSNVTGRWITPQEVADPAYWARHMLSPVRFSEGLERLLAAGAGVLLEAGPGHVLTGLAKAAARDAGALAIASLTTSAENEPAELLRSAAALWASGAAVDWSRLYAGEQRRSVRLPTYPFQRHAIPTPKSAPYAATSARSSNEPRIYERTWERWTPARVAKPAETPRTWLVLSDKGGFSPRVCDALRSLGDKVLVLDPIGTGADQPDGQYAFDAASLAREVSAAGRAIDGVIDLSALNRNFGPDPESDIQALLERPQQLMRGLAALQDQPPGRFVTVTCSAYDVLGGEPVDVAKAMAVAPVLCLPFEIAGVACRHADVRRADLEGPTADRLAARFVEDLDQAIPNPVVAYREGGRWTPAMKPAKADEPGAPSEAAIRSDGVYLIVGAGGLGRVVAETLATFGPIKLVLVSRRLPDLEPDTPAPRDVPSEFAATIEALRRGGAEVMTAGADVCDLAAMGRVFDRARSRFGRIDGVFHTAGVAHPPSVLYAPGRAADLIRPKLLGPEVLRMLSKDQPLDFVMLFSSTLAIGGGAGQAEQTAADACLDAAAAGDPSGRVMSVNWDPWADTGMIASLETPAALAPLKAAALRHGLSTPEAASVLRQLFGLRQRNLVVSKRPLDLDGRGWRRLETAPGQRTAIEPQPRPALSVAYVAPGNALETTLSGIWAQTLGLIQVGRDDNFFDLGGHSLLAVAVARLVGEAFGKSIAVTELFEHPTVGAFAHHLSGTGGPVAAELGERRGEQRRDDRRGAARRTRARAAMEISHAQDA